MTSPIPLRLVLGFARTPGATVHELDRPVHGGHTDGALGTEATLEVTTALEPLGLGDLLRVRFGDAVLDLSGLDRRLVLGILEDAIFRIHIGHQGGDATPRVVALQEDAACLPVGIRGRADQTFRRLLGVDGDLADGLDAVLGLLGDLALDDAGRLGPQALVERVVVADVPVAVPIAIGLVGVGLVLAGVTGIADTVEIGIGLIAVGGVGAVVRVVLDPVTIGVGDGQGGVTGRGLCVGRVGSQSGQKHQKQKLERIHRISPRVVVMCHRHVRARFSRAAEKV